VPSAFVTIRGVEYSMEYTDEYDPSVGIDGVSEWSFTDLTGPEVDALGVTDAENEAVCQTLTNIARTDTGPDDF